MLVHFNFDEFDSPDEAGSGLPISEGGKMCIQFLYKLDDAREIADIPFIISSGYRSERHNAKVGGRVGSSHLKGIAADIRVKNSHERTRILQGLIKVGFKRIGIGQNFLHCDLDDSKPQAIWLYP